MKRALLYLFIFITIQVSVTWAISVLWMLLYGTAFGETTAPMIITVTAVYSIVTLVIFIWRKWSIVSLTYLRSQQWNVFLWATIAAVGTILPSAWLQEQLPELPDNMEQTFAMIIDNNLGYLAICIFAPIVEELVFRGAILRSLLAQFNKHWYAILISAVFFALVHGNPAQMPHAFIIGILLGWLYYRTGSILPGVAFHWVNNTIAFVAYRLAPQSQDETIIELFNGNAGYAAACIVVSLIILIISLRQLNRKMNTYSIIQHVYRRDG